MLTTGQDMVATGQGMLATGQGMLATGQGMLTTGPGMLTTGLAAAHRRLLAPGGPERVAARRTLADELITRGAVDGHDSELLTGLLRQTVDLFLAGDRRAERRLGELTEILSRGAADQRVANAVGAIGVMLSIRAGELGLAEVRARVCLERGMAIGDAAAPSVYLWQLSAIRWYQGREVEVWARDFAGLPRSESAPATMYALVEKACLGEDAETCAGVYDLLLPYANLPLISGLGVVCFGSAQHPLGVAALTVGRLDRAVRHFRAAIDDNLALQHWPALALSRFRLAQALTRRGSPNDLRVAAEVLATARKENGLLGLPAPAYAGEQPGRPAMATCDRAGQGWLIRYGRSSVLVPDSVGMSCLAVLLTGPGRLVPAVELVVGRATEPERARLSVGKAIRRAIVTVTGLEPRIGAHLEECVRTGGRCGYLPH